MKTIIVVVVLGGLLWSGVVTQALVQVHPDRATELKDNVSSKLKFLDCYKTEFDNRHKTGLSPAQAKNKCKR